MQKPRIKIMSGGDARNAFMGTSNDSYIGTWQSYPTPINQKIYDSLRVLRARSREQALNNDYVGRYISLMKTNIIGSTGIRLQAKTKNPDGSLDKMVNDSIEKHWKQFTKAKNFDFFKSDSFLQIQKQVIHNWIVDGEVFIIKNIDSSAHGVSYQMMDAERVDVSHNAVLADGFIVMGIEYDAQGRIRAYHFLEQLKTIYDQYEHASLNTKRIPSDRVIHIFERTIIGQTRGLPLLSSSLYRLKLLEQYENVALVASKLGAANGGHYYRDENAGSYNGAPVGGNFEEEIEPGKRFILPEGWRYENHDPTYPQQMYAEFMKKALRGVASGLNISYNMLANDLEGVNFSSIRAAVQEDRELYKSYQVFFTEKLLEPIYEDWIQIALLKGQIKVKGRSVPFSKLDKCCEVDFVGRRWEWVDPHKDAKAKKELYEIGAKTLSSVIRDQGESPEDVFEETLAEQEYLKQIAEKKAVINEINNPKEEPEVGREDEQPEKVAVPKGNED